MLARPYDLHDVLDSEVRELLADGRVEQMVGADPEQAAEFERVLQRDRDRLRKARNGAEVLKADPRWRIEELNSGPLRKLSMLRMTDPAGHLDRHCEIIDCLKWGREHLVYVVGLHHCGLIRQFTGYTTSGNITSLLRPLSLAASPSHGIPFSGH